MKYSLQNVLNAFRPDQEVLDPNAPPRVRRALRVGDPVIHTIETEDGLELRLTRHQGGGKGPVLLVHCIGVSSLMYSIDTIETNLLEYLYAEGFDVWLIDLRLSIELQHAQNQATMDDIATKDYPAAVAAVRRLAEVDTIQVVAHGVGSSTFTMAMLAGLQGVRSAVCSQVSTHLVGSPINRIKTNLRLSKALWLMGQRRLTAYYDDNSPWNSWLYNRSLRFSPVESEELCGNPVCHRITTMYGPLWEHDQLNTGTHSALNEMFGVVNLTAFKQLSLITRKGYLVNANGEDCYLPNVERLAIPIAFIHGDENDCVLPESTEITFNLLCEKNGSDLYTRHLIPKYGHVDCLIGENASTDVYPLILEHLQGKGA